MSDQDDTADRRPDEAVGSPGDLSGGDPDLGAFLDRLRAAGHGPAPEVGDELAAVMATMARPTAPTGGAAPVPLTSRRPSRRQGLVGLVVVGAMAGGVGAAAADGLPRPVQRVVSDVVSRLTPFDLPRPEDRAPVAVLPVAPTVTPPVVEDEADEPGPTSAPTPTVAAEPARDRRSDDDDEARPAPGSDTDDHSGEDDGDPEEQPTTTPPTTDDDGAEDHEDDSSHSGSGSGSGSGSDDSGTPDDD